jgi:hypothetical protein
MFPEIEHARAQVERQRDVVLRYYEALGRLDVGTISQLVTEDHVTEWPQSGERIVGALGCVQVYADYPGGSPSFVVRRVRGAGRFWAAELNALYGEHAVSIVSLFEFRGDRIERQTDYFAEPFERPGWREPLTELTAGAV